MRFWKLNSFNSLTKSLNTHRTRATETLPWATSLLRHFCTSDVPPRSITMPFKLNEGRVLCPHTVDIDKVRDIFSVVLRTSVMNTDKDISNLYYGVSVVHHGNGEITEEEVIRLNKEVALRDAVRKVIYEIFYHVDKRPLGEEPTAKWILEDRIRSSDEEAWDFVISVNIDGPTEEELAVISEKGIKKVFWFVIPKRGTGDMRYVAPCEDDFICYVFPQQAFWKVSSA
ncbi:hypothetical protein IFM89_021078 [Coptis chinensis]|uniref:Uncharacterized protein n=1 Tax=Coptis chinensis TaxID=261450 RepID=A0A835HS20_9MAGN|nr:hypothetical protein IFM89_021078 [Coptis chinensis]